MSRKQREKRARAKNQAKASVPKAAEAFAPERSSTPANPTINRVGLIVGLVVFVGLFGVVLYLGDGPPPPEPSEVETMSVSDPEPEELNTVDSWEAAFQHKIPIDPSRDYIRGPVNAPVTIVEFTDFECPFCRVAFGYVKEVLERYPKDVRLVHKNFPLDMACNTDMAQQLHPYACLAAVMARCAGSRKHDLFWQLHDAIFEADQFDDAWLNAKASDLGVGDDAFNACVNGRDEFDEVRADIELGRAIGVDSTPTFYINGREAPSYEVSALAEIVEHILATD